MAKLIALEWDAREARIAIASPRGGDLVVEEAFVIDLASATTTEAISDREVSERLRAVFAERGLAGSDTLVALSRASIELRTLSLPLAPPEEIPDMVRFQAMQAFTSIGEDWPLDYVELEGHEDSVSVLAAVVSPKEVQQIQAICTAADVKTRCLVLRPFAAMSLLQRNESIDLYRGSLIVDVLPEGADLTAVSHGQVVFMRSVRLPSNNDPQAQARALVGELRRTIGAAQNQMGGGQIEQIIICGTAEEHAVVHQTVSESLPHDVVAFDPFGGVRLARQLEGNLPHSSGRYAPLLGMLVCELSGSRHTIDFLNPRKRPAPPSNKRRNITIAASVLAVLAVAASLFVWYKGKLDKEIAEYQARAFELKTEVEEAKVLVEKVNAVKRFTDGDITWLDEIREVANRLPDADHVILDEVSMGTDADRGGRLTLKGHVVAPDVIAELEDTLRYGDNIVTGKMGVVDRKRKDYPYLLDTSVVVPPDVQKDGHSVGRPHLAQQQNTAEKPDAKNAATPSSLEKTPVPEKIEPAKEDQAQGADVAAATTTESSGATETSDSPPQKEEPSATDVKPAVTDPVPEPKSAEPSTPDNPNTEKPQETDQAGSQLS